MLTKKLIQIGAVIGDIRELGMQLRSKNVGELTEVQIHFNGDEASTPIRVNSSGSWEASDNFKAVLEFNEQLVKEQAAIIKQLTDGPGDVEYIHPYDLAELINSIASDDHVDIIKNNGEAAEEFGIVTIGSTGKKYKQSIMIPQRGKARSKRNIITVQDGDTIGVIVRMQPSVCDPALAKAAVAQSYRVVSNSSGPVLTLVPLANTPRVITDAEARELCLV